MPSLENKPQESLENQKTDSSQGTSRKKSEASQKDDKKDESKADKSLSDPSKSDSTVQINPLAGLVPLPADPGTDKPEQLKSSGPGDNLLVRADQKLSSQIEELKVIPGDKTAIGDQDKTNKMTLKLNEVDGKSLPIPAAMETADKKDMSLLDKPMSALLIKGAAEGKSGDEKGSSGNSAPEGNLSNQNGSAGPFSPILLDKPQENAPGHSYGLTHQNEAEPNRTPLSTQDLPPEEKQIFQQLTGWLSNHRGNELQSIRLNLSPETLGTIQIDLSVRNQQVKAELVVSSDQVRELLEKHQDLLRNGLADNGLRVDQFTVRLEEPADYQAGGSMNFNNSRFFQRENQPTSHFWSQNAPVTTFAPIASPADATGRISRNSRGEISIYI